MKFSFCVMLELARDGDNFSLATLPDSEWLVHYALYVIDFCKQANLAGSCTQEKFFIGL